jgi:hypothetical protein
MDRPIEKFWLSVWCVSFFSLSGMDALNFSDQNGSIESKQKYIQIGELYFGFFYLFVCSAGDET